MLLLLLRSSIRSSWLFRSSAIIGLLPQYSSSITPPLNVHRDPVGWSSETVVCRIV
jgi:hypothetical protein